MTNRKRVNIKTVIADPVLREELVEGATDFICKVEGIRRDPLSPAARAVWEAAMNTPDHMPYEYDLAAALRAAADHLKKIGPWVGHLESPGLNWGVMELESIAAELEGANG